MNYTLTAAVALFVAIGYDTVVVRTRLITRKAFWTAYVIVLGFQLIVNGVLTGLRIVRYNPDRIIGWRIGYAPVEDLAFGFAMVLVTLATWVWLGRARGVVPAEPTADRSAPPRRGGGPRR